MKTLMTQQLAAQLRIETALQQLIREWALGQLVIGALIAIHEQRAGFGQCNPAQQTVWQDFRHTHSPEQAAGVLLLLELRGLRLADFVDAWWLTGHLPVALHRLWRQPSSPRDS